MKTFRTPFSIPPSVRLIGSQNKILTLGSCFADAIGSRLQQNKVNTLVNPFGTLFSPLAIHKVLRYSLFNEPVPAHTYLSHQEVFLNYDFHSELSATSRAVLEKRIAETIGTCHHFLRDADTLLLTYGTSWIYERTDTGEPVANCHKQPGHQFTKLLLSQKKILESFDSLYNELMQFNSNLRIILTVSPVRHIKDTIQLNSVSKSLLRLACHNIQESYLQVEYFPAFEIMMDDLRDYRFYKEDMIHPSTEAEEYIWNQFYDCYATTAFKDFIHQWKKITYALNHKPFHPGTKAHQDFLLQTLKQLEALQQTVGVEDEMNFIRKHLK